MHDNDAAQLQGHASTAEACEHTQSLTVEAAEAVQFRLDVFQQRLQIV